MKRANERVLKGLVKVRTSKDAGVKKKNPLVRDEFDANKHTIEPKYDEHDM